MPFRANLHHESLAPQRSRCPHDFVGVTLTALCHPSVVKLHLTLSYRRQVRSKGLWGARGRADALDAASRALRLPTFSDGERNQTLECGLAC
jgi:hypothetical protein